MSDPISIAGALNAIKTATDMVKALRSADNIFDKAELKMQIATLAEALADARLSLLDIQTEIESLRTQLAQSRAASNDRNHLVKRDNVYWFAEESGEAGPFCPRCFETDHVRMPLTELPVQMRRLAKYRCPQCQATY